MFREKPIISKWAADMYDRNETYTYDVDFLLSVIGPEPKRVLEVCCGSGRILVPLAKAGHTVFGLDADEAMLAKLPKKAEGLSNIQWKTADAVSGDWGKGFDVVVLAGDILYNIISDMDNAKAQELLIQKAASALVPGGHVFIEYQPGGHCVLRSGPSYTDDGERVIWEGTDSDGNFGRMTLSGESYDADTGMSSFLRRFELTLKNGETITQELPSQKHFAPLKQLQEWLLKAGFVLEQQYGDTEKNPVNGESHGVILFAGKY